MSDHDLYLRAAIDEARLGLSEGGIPIGSALVLDGEIVGRGHNRRIQRGSPILHGEMDCLENAGRLKPAEYARSTIYSTLSPCHMCTGAILLYRIPRVVVAERENFKGPQHLLEEAGVEVTLLDNAECIELMQTFIEERPDLWFEDIGETA